jgi:hypothetical protein
MVLCTDTIPLQAAMASAHMHGWHGRTVMCGLVHTAITMTKHSHNNVREQGGVGLTCAVWQQEHGWHVPVVLEVSQQLVPCVRPHTLTVLELGLQAWQCLHALLPVQLVNLALQPLLF